MQRAEPELRAAGERIEVLLEAASPAARWPASGPRSWCGSWSTSTARAWSGCWRSCTNPAALDDELLDRAGRRRSGRQPAAVHGLHPYDVETRVARALEGVRPYLGSHGGDVEFLGIDGDGVVRLRCWAVVTAARPPRSR